MPETPATMGGREYLHDSRFSKFATGIYAPDDAAAVYSARWIDLGDRADVEHNRQGYAFDDVKEGDKLINMLMYVDPGRRPTIAELIPGEVQDEVLRVDKFPGQEMALVMKRSGGYIYVNAWLVPQRVIDQRDHDHQTTNTHTNKEQ